MATPVPAAAIAVSISPSRAVPSTAQVAPLPRVDDFHVGHILHDGPALLKPAHETEESYIPVALARAHLARVVQDMHAMKEAQAANVNQIMERYKAMEAEIKRYYESYVVDLKRQAKEKVQKEQTRYAALETTSAERQQLASEEIRRLHEIQDERLRDHEHEKTRWRQEIEQASLQYEEELTRVESRIEREMAAALEHQAETLSVSHADEVQRLQHEWDDARADFVFRIEETKQTLQKRLDEMETSYMQHTHDLQRDALVEMESFKCLATIVNRVVDMDDQTQRRKRTGELQREIDSLAKQVDASVTKERSLERQLNLLKKQYDAMEGRAVRETMDVMLRTVELGLREADRVVIVPAPMAATHVIDGEAQTNDWEQVLAAKTPQPPPRDMCDASVATNPPPIQHDVAVESMPVELASQDVPVLSFASVPATQLQLEADAERFRERNAELLRSKSELKTLKTQLQTCVDQKNGAKARIKQWLSDFQKEHARDPTIEEKAQVKDLYLAFKASEEAYNTAKERVAKAKASHHELVVEIEAVSQWHALAATARASSRGEIQIISRPNSAVMTMETPNTLQEVETLAKEIASLRAELKVARADTKTAHENAERAVMEAKKAKADAKQTADRLTVAEAKTLEVEQRVGTETFQAKAEEKEEQRVGTEKTPGKAEEKEAEEKKEAKETEEERQRRAEERETYARESEAMTRERNDLRTSIAALQEELASRVAEKQALEKQIEQLRLHLELMDGHDDDVSFGLESDAKASSRHGQSGDGKEEQACEEEEIGDDGLEETMSSPLKTITEAERTDGLKEAQFMTQIQEAIEAGKAQWNRGDKAKCFQIYVKMCEKCIETLRPGRREDVAAFKSALHEAGRLPPAKGSMVLRRQLDNCLAACDARAKEREAMEATAAAAAKSPTARSTLASSPQKKSQHKKSIAGETVSVDDTSVTPVAGKAQEELKQKLKALESKAKADKVRITQLEAALSKAETQLTNAASSSGGSGANTVMLERRLADAEKKHAKALDDVEKTLKKEIATLSQQLGTSQNISQTLQDQVDALTKELGVAGSKASQLGKMEEEVAALRTKAAQAESLSQDLVTSKADLVKLEASYKEEQTLRKKYYNMIEDMKGKIRVYARCRPMSSSETERGCDTCVRFVDEFSLELQTSHGPKTFAYDQVFTPASTQDQVFEDTKNLLQSAIDGYNVCIFAYGQTGSGKTFTMTGSESLPGLSPRAIHHLFRLADESKGNNTITFQAFMLELYNDNLIDLLYLVDGGGHDAPKLDIKKNDRGMVFVSNITTKSCTSAQQALKLFDAANKKRQVGATKMNAESSRSHSVFSILVENFNKTTKTTTVGKLSLVDLAGSERAGKTGATNDRLKEAQAINKSLSALGDVIAALSAGEKFIPYRNNKLTQLMQDSLGGNAKTLMFVNISPADYNQEETQTSLQYASRVKLITNNANKTSESETVSRLKQIIKQLRSGKTDVELDGLGLE